MDARQEGGRIKCLTVDTMPRTHRRSAAAAALADVSTSSVRHHVVHFRRETLVDHVITLISRAIVSRVRELNIFNSPTLPEPFTSGGSLLSFFPLSSSLASPLPSNQSRDFFCDRFSPRVYVFVHSADLS